MKCCLRAYGLSLLLSGAGAASSAGAAAPGQAADPVRVGGAASLERAVTELGAVFTKETGVPVEGTYAASGKLVAQIREGAPLDVFVSADVDYPEELHKAGLAPDAPVTFAKGPLVLWTTGPLDLSSGLSALLKVDVKHVAIANPKVAPYGRAAEAALAKAGMSESIKGKLVFGESIAQVNHYVATGAAEVGITAKASVPSDVGRSVELAADVAAPLPQGAVTTKRGAARTDGAAARFVAFLLSPSAQVILAKYGYMPP